MKLRTRFAIGFSGVALVAAGSLFAFAWIAIDRSLEERSAEQRASEIERLDDALAQTALRLEEKSVVVEEALTRSDEDVLRLQDALSGSHRATREILDRVIEQSAKRKIDVLEVVRRDGTVVASAHYEQGFGRAEPSVLERWSARGADESGATGPAFLQAGVGTAMRLAFTHTRLVERDWGAFFLVTGLFLDEDGLAEISGRPQFACLEAPTRSGVLVVRTGIARDPFRSDSADDGTSCRAVDEYDIFETRQIEILPSSDGAERRALSISMGATDPRRAAVRRLQVGFAGISVGLLLLSLPLAAFFARRFATPIANLADGARAVAAGDLDVRVERPRGRGDELVALVDAFNRMAADLKDSRARLLQSERIAAWREIARRIAHEIKNPLTPIQLAVETTRKAHRTKHADFDEIFEESAQAILEEVESLKKLVKEFSEFARMPEPTLAPTDLNEAIRSSLRLFTGLPEGIAVETRLDESIPKLLLDRNQMSRALLNLVANAADAIGEKGTITITSRRISDERGDAVEVHVVDTGPGIPEADRQKIFTPYFTTKANGTGLGLAIVQRIVTDHGGEIRVSNGSAGGADFALRLPLPAALPAAALV